MRKSDNFVELMDDGQEKFLTISPAMKPCVRHI